MAELPRTGEHSPGLEALEVAEVPVQGLPRVDATGGEISARCHVHLVGGAGVVRLPGLDWAGGFESSSWV